MFRLLRYFALTSIVAFVAVALLLGRLYNRRATNDLVQLEERRNVALTRTVARAIQDELTEFITFSYGMSGDELRARPETTALRQLVLSHMEGQSIVKVKVYNLDGQTVFSTEPDQIGDHESDNPGFLAAMRGDVASQLTHRDTFNAFDGEIEDRDVLASYIPVYEDSLSGQIKGVFEIYSDLTPLLEQISERQRAILASLVIILGMLYSFLFLVIRRAEGIIRQQATELQEAKESAERANLAKSEFVSFVTHELKNPITVMRSYTDLLLKSRDEPPSDRQKLFLRAITRSVERMTALTTDLLDISRMEMGAFELHTETLNLSDIITEVTGSYDRLLREKEQSIDIDVSIDLPTICADRHRVQQVLSNLVSNAHKYTPAGGEIKVRTTCLGTNGDAGMITISVQDNGIGISDEDQNRVFQRFFRSEDELARAANGTGLGLHLAKNLVELQGGKMWFESKHRQGTTFHFTLPVVPD